MELYINIFNPLLDLPIAIPRYLAHSNHLKINLSINFFNADLLAATASETLLNIFFC